MVVSIQLLWLDLYQVCWYSFAEITSSKSGAKIALQGPQKRGLAAKHLCPTGTLFNDPLLADIGNFSCNTSALNRCLSVLYAFQMDYVEYLAFVAASNTLPNTFAGASCTRRGTICVATQHMPKNPRERESFVFMSISIEESVKNHNWVVLSQKICVQICCPLNIIISNLAVNFTNIILATISNYMQA